MQRNSSGQITVAGAIVTAIAALIAIFAFSSGVSVGDSATPSPSTVPSASPTPRPTTTLFPAPSTPADGPMVVDLDIATDHDVTVVIDDATGKVVGARTGRAGDGMSVRWFDVKVENIDADTISVTWVGLAVDGAIALSISEADGSIALDFVQDGPPAYSDATGFDRVLVIEFDQAVDAADVEVTFPKPLPA